MKATEVPLHDFFLTITQGLVQKMIDLDSLIAEAIISYPFICNYALGKQFNKLIDQPLRKMNIISDNCRTLMASFPKEKASYVD